MNKAIRNLVQSMRTRHKALLLTLKRTWINDSFLHENTKDSLPKFRFETQNILSVCFLRHIFLLFN